MFALALKNPFYGKTKNYSVTISSARIAPSVLPDRVCIEIARTAEILASYYQTQLPKELKPLIAKLNHIVKTAGSNESAIVAIQAAFESYKTGLQIILLNNKFILIPHCKAIARTGTRAVPVALMTLLASTPYLYTEIEQEFERLCLLSDFLRATTSVTRSAKMWQQELAYQHAKLVAGMRQCTDELRRLLECAAPAPASTDLLIAATTDADDPWMHIARRLDSKRSSD